MQHYVINSSFECNYKWFCGRARSREDIELICDTSSPESDDGVAPKPWNNNNNTNTNITIQSMHLKRLHSNTYHRLFPYRWPCQIGAGQWSSCLWWFGCLLWTCQDHDQAGGPTILMWSFFGSWLWHSRKFCLNHFRHTSFTPLNSKSGENQFNFKISNIEDVMHFRKITLHG